MVNGCDECTRLWRAYSEATNEHFSLDNKLQLAGLEHNHEEIGRLTSIVGDSRQKRLSLRDQITAHESAVHS